MHGLFAIPRHCGYGEIQIPPTTDEAFRTGSTASSCNHNFFSRDLLTANVLRCRPRRQLTLRRNSFTGMTDLVLTFYLHQRTVCRADADAQDTTTQIIEAQTLNYSLRGSIVNIKVLIGSALLLGGFMSGSAFAQTCRVTTQNGTGAVFYVPSGGSGSYNILAWGNGTGGNAATYRGLLTAAAERCVLVAAATTANSGSGIQVRDALTQATRRFANIIRPNARICTSGHSQGGGGSFNAANVIGSAVSCIIAVQPDTVFTTRIQRPVSASVDTTCIFSTGDVLAPALPSNARNCRANSRIYRQVTTFGTHFAPVVGTGGAVGRAMRNQIDRLLR